jgi:Mlc titration factor MtfA (ptsG expression regulator)
LSFLNLVGGLLQGGMEEVRFRLYYGPVFHRFLNHKYSYYTTLPWPLKLKFLRLVRDHYEYFEFVPRDGMKLTRAMNAIICSAASQIVLFLPKESLTFFEKILVYPDYYNSSITHKRHKGEVNPALQLIVFSWRGIEEGMNRPDDGLNLLLHEFAHALWLEHKLTHYDYTVLDEGLVHQFELLAAAEMSNLRNNEQHFFRRYAFENIEEFFAVAVENFFERPSNFSAELPHLYKVIAQLLHQNPLPLGTQR